MVPPPRSRLSPMPQSKQTVRTVRQRLPPEPGRRAQVLEGGSWTLNSILSEFTGIHAGLGRVFRSLGRLIDDPLDNFIGRRELRRLRKQLGQISPKDWAIFPE